MCKSTKEISIHWRVCPAQPRRWLGSRSPRRRNMGQVHHTGGKAEGDLSAVVHYRKGDPRDEEVRLLSEVRSSRTRGNGHRLLQGKFQLILMKKLFPKNMVQAWARPQKGGGISVPGDYKIWLDKPCSNSMMALL